jgi:DNA replication and repair protein RecF
MRICRLSIVEFRSLRNLQIEIPDRGFGLVGRNAAGKSSLLEAVAMLSTTKSPRTNLERELINWQSGEDLGVAPYARIEAEIENRNGAQHVEIGLEGDVHRSNRSRKVVSLSGKRHRASKVVGTLKCVLFEPPDIDLVAGSPGLRRRYLDIVLSQLDGAYLTALSRYTRIVEQRNSLLKSLLKDGQSWHAPQVRGQLDFWDTELVAHGSRILHRRLLAIEKIHQFARDRLGEFTGGNRMETRYVVSPGSADSHGVRSAHLKNAGLRSQSELAFAMAEALTHIRQDEFRRGVTLIGPHRDDLQIQVDGIDVGAFGSRGQQRLTAIALKLAEADLMLDEGGEQPVILLDDVFSELDRHHRELLSHSIGSLGAQVIVTATDRETLHAEELALPAIATIADGQFSWAG